MFIEPGSYSQILQYIESLQPGEGDVIMLLFGEEAPPDIPSLIEGLNKRNILFLGGVFPGLIYGNQTRKSGCFIKKFKALLAPFCTTDIASSTFSGFPDHDSASHVPNGSTAITFVDGLTPNIYGYLERANDFLGEKCRFIGGGAGSISLRQQPCVFSNEGFMADAAVLCVIDKRIELGVRHGWEHLEGPLVATQTVGNTIVQLNWQPALEVYNNIVEKACGTRLDRSNFASIAQGFPFGIMRKSADDIVRDPLAIGENNAIICIGEIPPNTVLYVLQGTSESLLHAARKAIQDCSAQTDLPIVADSTFIIDCITRRLFLGAQFVNELNLIRDSLVIDSESQELFGILSIGEIASYGKGLLELFNKTVVVGTLHDI